MLSRNSDDEGARWDRVGVITSSLKSLSQTSLSIFTIPSFADVVGPWSESRWSSTSGVRVSTVVFSSVSGCHVMADGSSLSGEACTNSLQL